MLLRSIDTQPAEISARYASVNGSAGQTDGDIAVAEQSASQASPNPGFSSESMLTVGRSHIASRMRADTSVVGRGNTREFAPPPSVSSQPVFAQQIGSAANAALRWDSYSLYTLTTAAQQQGLLNPSQKLLHGRLADVVLGQSQSPAVFTPNSLLTLSKAAGLTGSVLTTVQLETAARYVNTAATSSEQKGRLEQVLDTMRSLSASQPPQRSVQDMKNELKMLLDLPDKAFKKMKDSEVRAKYQEVMARMNGPEGSHTVKFGKFKANFSVDGQGNMTENSVKKGGLFAGIGNFFKKFGSIILTVCNFIPIPWIAIPARIISGVIAVVNAAKQKNVLGVIAGVASVVAGGAGAIAGKALSGVMGTVSKVADTVGKAARGVQATANAVKSGNVIGVVSAAASLVGSAAGVIGGGAESIVKVADKVGEWSNRVLVGKEVLVSIKNGHFVQAASQAAGLVGDVAGEFKGGEKIANIAGQVQMYAGYAQSAGGVVQSLRTGDVANAFYSASGVASGLGQAMGIGKSAGENRVARYLNYAGAAVQVGTSFAHGDAIGGFGQASALFGSVATQEFGVDASQANSGWANTVGRWLQHSGDIAAVVKDLRNGSTESLFNTAPGVLNDLAWDFGQLTGAAPQKEGLTRDNWKVKQDIEVWTGRGQQAWDIVGQVRQGNYAAAAHAAADLSGELGVGSQWTEGAHRLIDLGESALTIAGDMRRGDIDAAFDHAAAVAARWGSDQPDDSQQARVAADISIWLGRAADAVRIEEALRARHYEASMQLALQAALSLAMPDDQERQAEWLEKGLSVIENGFDLGRVIDSGDIERILQEAAETAASVGGLFGKRAA